MKEASSETRSKRDIASLSGAEFPQRPFPSIIGERGPGIQVVCKQSVLNDVYRHGKGSRDREICGVLVGDVYQDGREPYLYVEASIAGEHATNLAAQVTFTSQTWSHIQHIMDTEYQHKRIVGWYHTHPGFGIFLSAMDLFIHENFFDLAWQVAFVYDPLNGEEGMFVWRAGKPEKEPFLVDADTQSVQSDMSSKQLSADASPDAVAALAIRLRAVERRQRWLVAGLLFIAVLMFAWPWILPLMSEVISQHLPSNNVEENVRKAQ